MVATVVLGMLCVHLLCFCVMSYLISTRLPHQKMGMEVFALGNLLLGCAYILQLISGPMESIALTLINHTMTLCAPIVYVIGAARFFGYPAPLWRPLLMLAIGYSALQLAMLSALGPVAQYALLAASCTVLFIGVSISSFYGSRSFAKDLWLEMWVFGSFFLGLAALNAAKFFMIVTDGLEALNMHSQFQTVFYLYMSFLGTVLPPTIVWLVLRRLTDALNNIASKDPLTQLLNRRGLSEGLETYFRSRNAKPAHLLMIDIDHFKSINDTYGHKAGDLVLSHIAQVLKNITRQGDLVCRLGGEEFVVICLDTEEHGAPTLLAERARSAIANAQCFINQHVGHLTCTATIGISDTLQTSADLERAMQQADQALYRGKKAGRNRVEHLTEAAAHTHSPVNTCSAALA